MAADCRLAIKELHQWMAPREEVLPLISQVGRGMLLHVPHGVALIIGAWNFSIRLTLLPAIGAIAAGNCVLLKPSELAPAAADFLRRNVPKYLDPECIKVVTGGVQQGAELLKNKFDFIFFTGSTNVGKIVLKAAAENMTPTVLECGGKNPLIVDTTSNIDVAVKKIAWGKFSNAGQICLCPDYALVEEGVFVKFVSKLRLTLKSMFGDDPKHSPDFGRIVSKAHVRRISALLKDEEIFCGGDIDEEEKYVAPTIVLNSKMDSSIMTEEIFGPVLPVIAVKNVEEALSKVAGRPTPLAIYLFTASNRTIDKVMSSTRSGSVCVNAVIFQAITSCLPFGGAGESGFGTYNGRYSFEAFSQRRSLMLHPNSMDIGGRLLNPPHPKQDASKCTKFLLLKYGKRAEVATERTRQLLTSAVQSFQAALNDFDHLSPTTLVCLIFIVAGTAAYITLNL
eukprot:SM000014S00287  [mRNA]  locus=s14:465057:468088:- [translate_table: standard]